jgi:signal transduction histidine kinase
MAHIMPAPPASAGAASSSPDIATIRTRGAARRIAAIARRRKPGRGSFLQLIRRRRRPDPALVLLHTVCHELRPPVAALTSLTQAWDEQTSQARRGELARLAGQHAAHVESVLAQAAVAAQGLTDTPGQVQPLHRILPVALATVPGDRLEVTAGQNALDWPVASRQISHVLINLLGNAVRHGTPGAPVALRAAVRQRRLCLTVVNEGRLDHDLHDALHRPEPPAGDNGFGLWVVRQVIAACGGSIDARELRRGRVRVRVRLPRQR